jgi:hypothetical protein
MNRSLTTNGAWIAITVGTFLAGSHWARNSKDSSGVSAATDRPGSSGYSSRSLDGATKNSVRKSAGKSTRTGDTTGSGELRPLGSTPTPVVRRVLSNAPLINKGEIEALVKDAIKDPNPITRRHAFDRILESISPENVHMLRAAMAETGAGSDQWRLFDYAWGATDPAGALAHIEVIEEKYRDGFIGNMLPGLASVDPRSAIDFVEGLEAGKRRDGMTGRLIEGLRDHDLGMATDYVFQLSAGGDKNAYRHLSSLTSDVLYREGLEAARNWADAMPPGALQAGALDRIANRFVDQDPQAAAAWATRYAGDDTNARVIEEVGDEWAERDPASSVAWLTTLPAGRGQNEGMSSALHEWAKRDPVTAGGYLQTMAPSEARDAAIGGFSATIAKEDPQTAIAWAESITADGARIKTLTRVGQYWARQDPDAAREWVSTSGLPKDAQRAILNARNDLR